MCSDFRAVKMIGWLLPQNKLDNPSFVQLRKQEPPNSHINAPYFSTVSITHNRHFWQNIMAQATGTITAKVGDGNKDCGNININTIYNSDEDLQIMRWLSPLEPDTRHHGVRIDRLDGVGEWLLETSEFLEWRRGGEDEVHEAVLFCSGNPGVGKTYLR